MDRNSNEIELQSKSSKKTVRVTEPDQKKTCKTKCSNCCYHNLLLMFILIGVCIGIGLGVVLRLFVPAFQDPRAHPREMMYLFFPAEITIRILTLLTLPLIVSSLISAIGILDAKLSGQVGLIVMGYYISTTILAVTEGFLLVYAIQPGKGISLKNDTDMYRQEVSVSAFKADNRIDSLLDMIRNVFPDNLITMTFHMYGSHVTWYNITDVNGTLKEVEQFSNSPVESINIIGLTVMSLIFGAALSSIGPKGRLLFCVFDAIFDTIMKIIKVVFWLYPVAIVFMLAHTVVKLDNPLDLLQKMFLLVLTVLIGLSVHVLIVMPVLLLVLARRNPYKHLLRCFKALVTGFATNNSSVTIPVTMDCLEKARLNNRIIRFMIPMGASVNMDGFALYEAISAIFIATLNGMNPGPVQVITLGLTAVAVSIGAPTAGSGLVLYVILFKSIGLPLEDIALLLPYDWILGRLRTMTNIWGDCVGVAIVHRLTKQKFADQSRGKKSHDKERDESHDSHSSGDEVEESEQPELTRFRRLDKNDWSLRLVNENGDSIYVSKV